MLFNNELRIVLRSTSLDIFLYNPFNSILPFQFKVKLIKSMSNILKP